MAAHHGANEGPNRLTEEACHACAPLWSLPIMCALWKITNAMAISVSLAWRHDLTKSNDLISCGLETRLANSAQFQSSFSARVGYATEWAQKRMNHLPPPQVARPNNRPATLSHHKPIISRPNLPSTRPSSMHPLGPSWVLLFLYYLFFDFSKIYTAFFFADLAFCRQFNWRYRRNVFWPGHLTFKKS